MVVHVLLTKLAAENKCMIEFGMDDVGGWERWRVFLTELCDSVWIERNIDSIQKGILSWDMEIKWLADSFHKQW
jgi:hypothetical protein